MVFKRKIDGFTRGKIITLYTECQLAPKEIKAKCPSVSLASIYRIIGQSRKSVSGPKKKMGRPTKFTERDEREVIRSMINARKKNVNFTAKYVHEDSGCGHVSYRTIVRAMNKHGYNHLKSRKKGMMTENDRKIRVRFAKEMLKSHSAEYWKTGVAFYLDGIGFVHKTNPLQQTQTPKTRVWRKKSEGLKVTTKGQKAGYGGKLAKFIVCISHGKGVVYCKPYSNMNGPFFASVIENEFNDIYEACGKQSRVFVQDGDPSQNSKGSKSAMKDNNVVLQTIPARSPDINPIENVFNIVKRQLEKDTIDRNIERESFKDFVFRTRRVIESTPVQIIDNIISSMHKRMDAIIKSKGYRLRY